MSTNDPPAARALIGANLVGELGRALSYHWMLILFVALGTVLCTYVSLQFVSDQYVSTGRLLVKLGRENVELPVTVEKGGLLSTGVRKEEINSEIQLISSRPLIEATVDALGLDAFKLTPPPPRTWFQWLKAQLRNAMRAIKEQIKEAMIVLNLRPRLSEREEALLLVQNTLDVEREKDSDVIAVSVRLPSAELAMQVVDTLVNLYLDRRVEVRRDPGMSDFFDEQLVALREQLNALDDSKLRLRDARNISAVDEERALLLARLQTLYTEIANDKRELKMLVPGRRATGNVAGSLSSFPNLEQLRNKITELRIRRTDLLQKFTEGSEQIDRIEREIAPIESTLRQAIAAQKNERSALARSIEQRLQSLNSGEVELEVIERDRAVSNQNYQTYARRREEARVSEALDVLRVSNIAVLSRADKPIQSVAPRKVLIVGLSFPFGVLSGLAIALLLEYLNQTIRDERDLDVAERPLFLGLLRSEKGDA